MDYPERKHPRLKTFDYAVGGTFFVTICTHKKEKIFGFVVDSDPAYVCLTPIGEQINRLIESIPEAYPGVIVHASVVMPNHIHLLLQIPNERPVSLFMVIRGLKTLVTRRAGRTIWQASFHEHIVRDEVDALRCWKYIDENPKKWALDCYYA
ncbi:MAG: transposase [Faecousia sp.]